ncbi:MAG: DNA polymerase III subunit chi [Pseudomonadota bacterium]|nr:DNA polymerase III subunit chi [Pseudomonadota bacterium]HJO35176.1 DNA polymerase III subunit chi [Gammaproteobacteria bacterium]
MTRVSFYVLQPAAAERPPAACRIVEKAYRLGKGIYVHLPSPAALAHFDDLLWTFRQGSFVPHLPAANDDGRVPVLLGSQARPQPRVSDVLVNLADEVPGFFGQFDRLIEIVGGEEEARTQARERFRFYRDRGYALETLDLPAA